MYALFKKILFQLDPEMAHLFVKKILHWVPGRMVGWGNSCTYPQLKTQFQGIGLNSPIGLAAGFDKNAEMLPWLQRLGFGFIEIGSVTAAPSVGNDKPRIFRLPKDESLINRMGLPNEGCEVIEKRLQKTKKIIPLGINLAKTPVIHGTSLFKGTGIEDFISSFGTLANQGDFIVFNLSCPNTQDGKTFEDPVLFSELASAIGQMNKTGKPLLIKLSPDLSREELNQICPMALENGFKGFVLTNTTRQRGPLQTSSHLLGTIGLGGLSGRALRTLSNQTLQEVRGIVGKTPTIIACGGIMEFSDLVEKLALGADLFEIYTAFIYRGPFFVSHLNKKLAQFCQKMGVTTFVELKGQRDLLDAL